DGHVAFLRDVIDGGLRRGKRQGTDVVPLAAASLPSPSPAVTDGRSREYLACKGTTGCERVAGT
ncbi:hypothetical protein QMA10_16230, partial [Arthrobacter sp. APC 3897]|uniref:hypothetical protein n=1 Tax=Arthrobacter sp. APC 3897 TaxID=3035204 RepID=UPI0025B4A0B1